jgi:hypothetical protein
LAVNDKTLIVSTARALSFLDIFVISGSIAHAICPAAKVSIIRQVVCAALKRHNMPITDQYS